MAVISNQVLKLYRRLYQIYGPQGWWPLLDLHNKRANPPEGGFIDGYHPGDYTYPKNRQQIFEICLGALLTQNTTWFNAGKALLELEKHKLLSEDALKKTPPEVLAKIIRPARYYNQKARKIKEFVEFFFGLDNRLPSRDELLAVWGIGEETADSILLYAYKQPEFVIDAYTRRVLKAEKILKQELSYRELKVFMENNLPKDYRLFQEYHALIVEHAKNI